MPAPIRALLALGSLVLTAAANAQHEGVADAPATPAATVDYLRDVRPILAQHCYQCHGPDAEQRKADLRLDRRDDAFAMHDGYAALVPGKPDDSEALLRVTSDDPDEVMPPPDKGEKLKAGEVEVLRRWIAEGASWQEHWAFVPPVRPTPPTTQDTTWPKSELDRFVLARLEREGLQPSPEAERSEWLRRVTFDLIGLPPTPAELDAFLQDKAEDAFAKVVDRLLADERYGERMATPWLDLARYADSSGYQRDVARQAWKWRDWVVNALNANMPFDRFAIEQLAGDLLPEPTLEQLIATGFNRNHPVNTEAGEELDEYRSAYVIDRVHTTATTFLGLTVACAQCHDHKYDPISHREFYSFYAFFNSIKEKDNGFGRNPPPAIAAPGPEDAPRLAALERRIALLKARLERDDPLSDEAQAAWEQATAARLGAPVEWTTLRPTEYMAQYGSRLNLQVDGSILASGPVPARETYDLVFTPGARKIEALRIEALPDPSMPHGASGRADDGRFILSKLALRLVSVADSSDAPLVEFAVAAADVNQERDRDQHYLTAIEPGSIESAIAVDGDGKGGGGGFGRFFGGGWSIAGDERLEAREAVLVPVEPLVTNGTSLLRLSLEHDGSGKFRSALGRFRISFTEDPRLREQLVPIAEGHWHAIGPFHAESVDKAFAEAFGPEQDLEAPSLRKKHEQPVLEEKKETPKKPEVKADKVAAGKAAAKPAEDAAAKPPIAEAAKAREPETAEPDAEQAAAEAGEDDEAKKKPKPRRLGWEEQRAWRDGRGATVAVQGPASAHYLTRKLHTATPRTARIELSGGAAAKVWLNGKLVADFPPVPEAPAAKQEPPDAEQQFDMFGPFGSRSREVSKGRELTLGLKAGDNHLVVKLIGKGAAQPARRGGAGDGDKGQGDAADGGAMAPPGKPSPQRGAGGGRVSFTFSLEADGDDVIDYETAVAVRARIAAPASTPTAEASERKPRADAGRQTVFTYPLPAGLQTDETKPARDALERRHRAVRSWYRTRIDVAGRVLAAELRRLEREKDELEAKLPSALVMKELSEPRPTHVFIRGSYRDKGEQVATGTPSMLPPMPDELPKNRLGLAQWLVSGEHPLTARVAVNRAWQLFFGLGIVSTPGDFGIRGAPPSHPELLDWLATEFVRTGWDLKQLHRTIVLSATYRQSGHATAAQLQRDPDNVLLARGPHQRLSAEMVRDQALAVSGLLVQKLGGEPVKPHQPAGLWKATLGSRDWTADKGEKAQRRGLYVYWKRGVPYPSLMAFDAAKRETCTVERPRTTTPLQALVTLNDPVYVEAGRALGLRILKEGGADDRARLAFGFRLLTSRQPVDAELQVLDALLGDLRKHYEADAKAAKLALGIAPPKKGGKKDADEKPGEKADEKKANAQPTDDKKPRGVDALPEAERAAWAQLGATLLNLEAAARRG
ncbi:MAG: PSD1 and planctomycete cytochrome C domain-containing protein [Planctomycetota bacterium]